MDRVPAKIIRELHDYWSRNRQDSEVPDRSDFDPVDIPGLLPHLYLLNVLPGPRYEFRLVGTAIAERLGRDPTGKAVDGLIGGEPLRFMERLFGRAVEARQAVYSHSGYRYPPKNYLTVHRIILPLTNGGTDIELLVVGQLFEDPSDGDPSDGDEVDFHAVLSPGEGGDATYTATEFEP